MFVLQNMAGAFKAAISPQNSNLLQFTDCRALSAIAYKSAMSSGFEREASVGR
jgi:hypothetical protein